MQSRGHNNYIHHTHAHTHMHTQHTHTHTHTHSNTLTVARCRHVSVTVWKLKGMWRGCKDAKIDAFTYTHTCTYEQHACAYNVHVQRESNTVVCYAHVCVQMRAHYEFSVCVCVHLGKRCGQTMCSLWKREHEVYIQQFAVTNIADDRGSCAPQIHCM